MVFFHKKILQRFLTDEYLSVVSIESLKKLNLTGSELKGIFSLDDKKKQKYFEGSRDILFHVENTRNIKYLDHVFFFVKELFNLNSISLEEYKKNLRTIFNSYVKGIHIKDDILFLSEDFILSLNKDEIRNMCDMLFLSYSDDQLINIGNISFSLFGYSIINGNIVSKPGDLDELFISFFSSLSSKDKTIKSFSKLSIFSLKNQFSISFNSLFTLLGKKIDKIHVLRFLRLYGYECVVNFDNENFFVHFFEYSNINNTQEALQEILRIIFINTEEEISLNTNSNDFNLRNKISKYFISNNIEEINTLPFSNNGFLLSNPLVANKTHIRDSMYSSLSNAKKSVFEISSIFSKYKNKLFSFQFVGIYEISPGISSNKLLFDLLFYISSSSKPFLNEKNISIIFENDFLTVKNKYYVLFRQKLETEFVFTEINLSLFNLFHISPFDLHLSKKIIKTFSYSKYIDQTFTHEKNILTFWRYIFFYWEKNKKRFFFVLLKKKIVFLLLLDFSSTMKKNILNSTIKVV